jgi:hypothetical protein
MSYGTSLPDQFRRAGDFVDKILRGTKPGVRNQRRPLYGEYGKPHQRAVS